ncbi:MAG: thiamine-phosphate kinase [Candidatus Omnitrophica bacterium]|nr:thiamine-phosphate kinase [Candidatus Omnitrophota bacterium]
MKSEFELIEWLKRQIPRNLQGDIGIGDDAAVLSIGKGPRWLFATDVVVDGVDFMLHQIDPALAGRKALAVNLSDIAAMAGDPVAFVVSLGIPPMMKEKVILRFYRGMIALAKKFKVRCVGGDISKSRQFFASISILGCSKTGHLVTRSGAHPGDWIAVTGTLGGSILGHHYAFVPRLREAHFLARHFRPTAMIDVSDGLLQDLGHILRCSRVGANLDLEKIPVSAAAYKLAQGNSQKALESALTSGEDFELLFTVSPRHRQYLEQAWKSSFPHLKLSWIGRVERGKEKIFWSSDNKKAKAPRLSQGGFTHF